MPVYPARESMLVPAVELMGSLRFRLDGSDYTATLERAFYTPRSFALALRRAMRDVLPEPAAETGYGFRLHYHLTPAQSFGTITADGGALWWSNGAGALDLAVLHSDPLTGIFSADGFPLVRGLAAFTDLSVPAGSRVRWTNPSGSAPAQRNPAIACQFVWPELRRPVRVDSRRVTADWTNRSSLQTESGAVWPVARGEQTRLQAAFEHIPLSQWVSQGWDRAAAPGGPFASGSLAWLFPDVLKEEAVPVRPLGRSLDIDRTVPGTRSVKIQLAEQPLPASEEETEAETGDSPFTYGRYQLAEDFTDPLTGEFSGDTGAFINNSGVIEQTGATTSPATQFARLWPTDSDRFTANALIRVKLWRPYPTAVGSGSLWEAGVALAHSPSGTGAGSGTAVVVADTGTARELRMYSLSTGGAKGTKVTLGTLSGTIPRSAELQEQPEHRLTVWFRLFVLTGGAAVTRVRAWYNGEGPFTGDMIPPTGADSAAHPWMLVCSNGSSPASNTMFDTVEVWDDVSGWRLRREPEISLAKTALRDW